MNLIDVTIILLICAIPALYLFSLLIDKRDSLIIFGINIKNFLNLSEQKNELRSVWIKTAEQQLFYELETEYGFPREENYGNLRGDNQIIYHAVSKDEPLQKSKSKIKKRR